MRATRRTQPYRRGAREPSSVLQAIVAGKPMYADNPQDVQRQTLKKGGPAIPSLDLPPVERDPWMDGLEAALAEAKQGPGIPALTAPRSAPVLPRRGGGSLGLADALTFGRRRPANADALTFAALSRLSGKRR